MTHTKGPWYVAKCEGFHVQSAVLEVDGYVCRAEGRHVDEAEANARLIASAPDLLEALDQLLWAIQFDKNVNDRIAEAEQAIRKAKS